MQLVLALVEEERQPLQRPQPHVVAAVIADLLVGFPVAREQHLFALGALHPEIVRHFLAGDQRTQLGADEIGQPVHYREIPCCLDYKK